MLGSKSCRFIIAEMKAIWLGRLAFFGVGVIPSGLISISVDPGFAFYIRWKDVLIRDMRRRHCSAGPRGAPSH